MLAQLDVQDFRNIERLSWRPGAGAHLLLGPNGAGKTSVLEAVYLLATTRSFRTPRIAECRRNGTSLFRVSGEVEGDVRARLEMGWSRGKGDRRLNGKRSSLAEYLSYLPTVCWTSESAEVLSGPPQARRRFLDRGLLGLGAANVDRIARYRRGLEEKRSLLLGGGRDLQPWNTLLAKLAEPISKWRSVYVEKLSRALGELLEESDLDIPPLELRYRPSPARALEGASAIEEELRKVMRREIQLKQAMIGPHRDELELRWRGRSIRRIVSAGERKVLGLLLLAAHGRVLGQRGARPIYLLDDVDTELDEARLGAIWSAFRGARQLIASSNRPQIWEAMGLDGIWLCEAGKLHRSEGG